MNNGLDAFVRIFKDDMNGFSSISDICFMIQCMALERAPFGLGISRVHERFERYAMHAKGPSVYGIQLRYWQKRYYFLKNV